GRTLDNGGAINVTASPHQLFLRKVRIIDNVSQGSGGGLYTTGSLVGVRLVVKLNKANAQGGGLWIGQGLSLIKSLILNNSIPIADRHNGGGGLYVDNGDCILDRTRVNNNNVSYNASLQKGGSGGGVIVINGSLYVQNNSHIDNNSA